MVFQEMMTFYYKAAMKDIWILHACLESSESVVLRYLSHTLNIKLSVSCLLLVIVF